MIYKFITNHPEMAGYAVSCGVNRIFVDMEYLGKEERQGHLDTHRTRHTLADVRNIRSAVPETELMVRVNPVHRGSASEIAGVIRAGADIIMLPMFTNAAQVEQVGRFIDGACKLSLLLETPQAFVRLNEILEQEAFIDEIHVGLNDLHLGFGLDFMFEVLADGVVDVIAGKVHETGTRFGFGGVARVGEGAVPAELILGEHVRLGSEMVILSRTFHQNAGSVAELKNKLDLREEMEKLDACLNEFSRAGQEALEENRQKLAVAVRSVVHAKTMAAQVKFPAIKIKSPAVKVKTPA